MTGIKRRSLKDKSIDDSILKAVSKEETKNITFKLNAELKYQIDIICAIKKMSAKDFFNKASEELLKKLKNTE